MKPLADCRLYTFIDHAYLAGRDPRTVAQQLCDGGADLIQLRAKNLPVPRVQELAESILPITRTAGVWLVINDHLNVAQAVGAPLCHLGQEDFSGFAHVSELFLRRAGPGVASPPSPAPSGPPLSLPVKIGLSTHAPAQAHRAVAAGADYVAVGPVYRTQTKPTAQPVTLQYVRWAAEHLQVPWFAIGGINLSNLPDVLAAGARRVCVVSAILNTPDLVRACQAFKNRLLSAPVPPGN
jgi:thiamine-phosphate pyrophosphorylase